MRILRNPEVRGILGLLLVAVVLGGTLMAMTGKLEQWFGITWFSGPRALDKIVFVSDRSGRNEIWLMDPDGSNQKRLTSGARAISPPAIAPTGNRIAFVARQSGNQQVFSISARGGSPEMLTGTTASKFEPGYSPDGKRLSFVAAGRVYVADLNGENLDPVLPTHEELHSAIMARGKLPAYSQYAWAPGGRALAGVTQDQSGSDTLVYLPELKGEAVNLAGVTSSEGGDAFLAYMPKIGGDPGAIASIPAGKRLAIKDISWAAEKPVLAASLRVANQSMVLLFDAEEGTTQPVIAVDGQEFGDLSVSPDGAQIAVAVRPLVEKDGREAGLVRVDLQSGAEMIAPGDFRDLAYSPEGDRVLATIVEAQDKRDVVVIDASTGEVTRLTKGGHSFNAIWSPVSEK